MNRQVFLTTAQTELILAKTDDAETISSWFNDPEVSQYVGRGTYPMTIASEEAYLEKMYTDEKQLMLCIWHKVDKKLIGVVGLHNINLLDRTATYGVTIGDKAYWSKSIGTEVLNAMLTYAFERQNLRNVTLSVLGNNPRGKRCYEKCGFTEVGVYPKHRFKMDNWEDEILMIAVNPDLD